MLTGGSGSDIFVIGPGNVKIITDFNPEEGDQFSSTIDLIYRAQIAGDTYSMRSVCETDDCHFREFSGKSCL